MPALTIIFAILFYAATALLVGGVGYKIWSYARTPQPLKIPTMPAPRTRAGVALRMLKEVTLFESLFKANKVFMEKSKNPYATPFYYGARPLQSGWVSQQNLDAIKNSAAVVVSVVGNGRVINIADNPNFRAFWLGGSKLFMNAIFFGRIIDAASGRTEE